MDSECKDKGPRTKDKTMKTKTEVTTEAVAEALAHIKAHGLFTVDELRAIGEHLNSTDEEG